MDFFTLQRDPRTVEDSFKEVGNSLLTKTGCKIYFPKSFIERNLAKQTDRIDTIGYCAIVVDGRYGVMTVPAMIPFSPRFTNQIPVGDDLLIEMIFEPNSIVIPDLDLVKDETLTYYIYTEFVGRGNVPPYMSYFDLGNLFRDAKRYAGISIGFTPAVFELLVANISRFEGDLTTYYRQKMVDNESPFVDPPVYIGMSNVTLNATNTTARLIGSNYEDALTAALVNPSTRNETTEDLLLT